jgi:hypothetical protein
MSTGVTSFFLPLGLQWEGKVYREGNIHLATTLDELEIQGTDEVGMNARYRDIMLLSRVVDDFEGLNPVTIEMIENLFEADFLYLQALYRELNGDGETKTGVPCPGCGKQVAISLPKLYRDMSLYKQKGNEQE